MLGVIEISDVLKTPTPAGFVLSAEKSPPSAPNAPPMLLNRAVPPNSRNEYLKASISFWANVADPVSNISRMNDCNFFIMRYLGFFIKALKKFSKQP